jgi:hypothetical protein
VQLCERGDLNSHLAKCRHEGLVGEGCSSQHQIDMAIDCAAGLAFLHAHAPFPIVHNDLKSFNVLVSGCNQVSHKRLVVESPWSQFTSECQRF